MSSSENGTGVNFGIGADRAGGDQLLASELAAGLEDVQAHHQVVVGERRRVAAVEADAAHVGGQVQDHLGALEGLEARRAVAQVVLGGAHRSGVGAQLSSRRITALPRKPAPPVTTTVLPDQNSDVARSRHRLEAKAATGTGPGNARLRDARGSSWRRMNRRPSPSRSCGRSRRDCGGLAGCQSSSRRSRPSQVDMDSSCCRGADPAAHLGHGPGCGSSRWGERGLAVEPPGRKVMVQRRDRR